MPDEATSGMLADNATSTQGEPEANAEGNTDDAAKAAAAAAAAAGTPQEKAAAEKAATDKAEADKVIGDKAIADKALADKAEADKGKSDDKGDDKKGAPETYGEFTLPEKMELDTAALEKFTPMARELDLTQDQAQRLVTFYAGERQKIEQSQLDAWEKSQTEWRDATKSDEEVGGVKLEENLGIANKALVKFGTPKLQETLLATGIGNNVELIRFAYRVGKAMSEDSIGAGSPALTEVDRANILFPNQN